MGIFGIFLSYSCDDDNAFVERLGADLKRKGFIVWFDRKSVFSSALTFDREIRDALRTEVDRVIYVGGPNAAVSPNSREECRLAVEFDSVLVMPILRLGDYTILPEELKLLHCEDFRDDTNYESSFAKLVTNLSQPTLKLGALFAVPPLPVHFLARLGVLGRMRNALVADLPGGITTPGAHVGVHGMSGVGKSVLAAALAKDRGVRQSYPDGIVWISFGQDLTHADLLSRLRDAVQHLGGNAHFDSVPQGQRMLHELLHDRAVLLVMDDLSRAGDAQAFECFGPRCRMLVTTRDAGILHTLRCKLVTVPLFTESEALQLLANVVGVAPSALPLEAREVADECGMLPLALALSGGMVKKRGGDFRVVLEYLRQKG